MKILLAEQEAVLRDVEKALDEVTDTDFDVLVEKARATGTRGATSERSP